MRKKNAFKIRLKIDKMQNKLLSQFYLSSTIRAETISFIVIE